MTVTTLADKLLVKEWLAIKKQNLLSKMKIPKTHLNTTDVDTFTLENLPSSYVLVCSLTTNPLFRHRDVSSIELSPVNTSSSWTRCGSHGWTRCGRTILKHLYLNLKQV
jgi:hypothetical protein